MPLPLVAGLVLGTVLGFVVAGDLRQEDAELWVGTPSPKLRIAFTDAHGSGDEHDDEVRVVDFEGFETVLVDDAAHPAWSPDGTRIAFERKSKGLPGSAQEEQDDLWIVNADGTGELRLTSNPAEDHEAAWSPDGRAIAFVSSRAAFADLYVMNADGSGARRLTRGDVEDRDAAWSPDGRTIAFARNGEIWTVALDGSKAKRLAASRARSFSEPNWSPDGRSIVFVSGQGGSLLGGGGEPKDIWLMRADGTGRTRLTSGRGPFSDIEDDEPDWSPDGRWIAFERSMGIGCTCEEGIWVMDAGGRNAHQVTRGTDTDPKWWPRPPATR